MIPELIVPDLKECKLKPYVSYQSFDVVQSEFTAKNLFDAVYSFKIREDFTNNKLKDNGEPIEANLYEKLRPEEARNNAYKTGCDLFTEDPIKKIGEEEQRMLN